MSITVRAAAKINLCLGVGPVRDDGYHPLETVYQAIGLYDDVTVIEAPRWSVHTMADAQIDVSTVPADATNLALRAGAALAAHHGVERAARVEIQKGIPVAGGLAGGSADAAATLVALDRLWDLNTSDEDLLALAATLGSDVPFALLGGTALGTGRGEMVAQVPDATTPWWVVVPHEIGLLTPAVYRHFDVLAERGEITPVGPVAPDALLSALAAGDHAGLAAALANDLTPAAYALRPDLAAREKVLRDAGADAVLLSGSGPTQLLLHRDPDSARAAAGVLTDAGIPHFLAPGPVAGCHVVAYA